MNFENLPIYVVGSGNVAWNLANAFSKAGIPIHGICSRNKESGFELCKTFNIPCIEEKHIFKLQGIFILAITDKAIEHIASHIDKKSIVIHTSGSTDIAILQKTHHQSGVFYPLQTFNKYKEVDFSTIPILIEYSTNDIKSLLYLWAYKLNTQVTDCNSADRMKYHVAAVFACNFVNHMLAITENWLNENHLDINLLKPLINETVHKALQQGAYISQTGPAIRNDQITIEKHLKALESHVNLKKIYSFVTESIVSFHTKNQ